MELQQSNISANNFEQCTKCTVCTAYCPVSAVNPLYPGPKQAGPDGERYRLKSPAFFDETLKYCLNCKRCEVSCPSGVRIGDIIQAARIKYTKKSPSLRDTLLANTDFVGTAATAVAPVVNWSLGLRPAKAVMDASLAIDHRRRFPAYASQRFTTWYRKNEMRRQENFGNQVTYFHGCYVNYNNPQLGKDLIKVMNAVGYGVRLMDREKCCGVAKISNRLVKRATRDAMTNLEAIRQSVADGREVIATSSTCVFTMRDEYPHLLNLDNSDVRGQISLATRMLHRLVEEGKIKLAFRDDFRMKVAYHTPCHMEKLGWAIHSTSLLQMIPGVEFVILDSQCCGIAGTYGFKKENYDYSQAIGDSLFQQIRHEAPDVVATDCETCKWQIEMSTGFRVENPISIIAQALDVKKTMAMNNV